MGGLRSSKPCPMCVFMMKKFGIKRVYYSDNDDNIIMEKIEDIEDLKLTAWMRYSDIGQLNNPPLSPEILKMIKDRLK